ncbi:MAG: hypothetical protein EBR58_06040 [Betaproteobacteria bacterium]|nr:hypothetical protein [Betaproteobacteria bacterium]
MAASGCRIPALVWGRPYACGCWRATSALPRVDPPTRASKTWCPVPWLRCCLTSTRPKRWCSWTAPVHPLDCAGTPLWARLTRRAMDQLELQPGQAVWAQIKAMALVR